MPKQWTDQAGNVWPIVVSVATVRRVKELAGVDLLTIFDGELINELTSNPVTAGTVLWAVCQPVAQTRSINEVAFAELLHGDYVEAALIALMEALIDFFPSSRREVLRRLWDKTQALTQRSHSLAAEKLDSPATERAIVAALERAEQETDRRLRELGSSSTSSPESSG